VLKMLDITNAMHIILETRCAASLAIHTHLQALDAHNEYGLCMYYIKYT